MVFQLTEELVFPPPSMANDDGLLAIGGDLSPNRLLLAYASGIFPWFSEENPDVLWWSPDPRFVLFPKNLKISKSLNRTLQTGKYTITFDQCFDEVITACARIKRKAQKGTWIDRRMINAFNDLFDLGYAHSVECFYKNDLVGGLYGISLGRAFFGESMFHRMPDASKVALFYLSEYAQKNEFLFIDAQIETNHLKSLGAINISRQEYLMMLQNALKYDTIPGKIVYPPGI